ncbi:MAG: hypothetical protein AB2604_01560 [Candidatus Thiodiazotropha taylori]
MNAPATEVLDWLSEESEFNEETITEQDRPMTPAHAGGAMGELDAAFYLGRRGFQILLGPGGAGGHQLTAHGVDIVAFNPQSGELWIVDNKSSGGTSTVQSASAITTNLARNLDRAIRDIERQPASPHKQRVLDLLRTTRTAVRGGHTLPRQVSLVITNAGGYHSGISARLRRLGIRFVDVTGPSTRSTRRADIRHARQQGVRPGRPTTHARPSGGGSTIRRPAPPPVRLPTSPRGGAAMSGLMIAFQGVNFLLNWLVNRREQRRVQERLAQEQPGIEREQRRYPDQGIVIIFYYHQVQAPPDSLIQPAATFSHLRWASGRTRDEALRNLRSRSTVSPAPSSGGVVRSSTIWIPPRRRSNVGNLQKPFRVVGRGIFPTNQAVLQDVEWGGITGFDDSGQTRLRLPTSPQPRFFILEPPQRIQWPHGRRIRTTDIPVITRRSNNGQNLKAVDLDPVIPIADTAAVPVFPVDNFTDRLFRTAAATQDNLRQLRFYLNINRVRWVRPNNIWVMGRP